MTTAKLTAAQFITVTEKLEEIVDPARRYPLEGDRVHVRYGRQWIQGVVTTVRQNEVTVSDTYHGRSAMPATTFAARRLEVLPSSRESEHAWVIK